MKKSIVKIIDGTTDSHIVIITDMPITHSKKDKNLGEMADWDSFIKDLQECHYVKVIYDPRLDPPDVSDLLAMAHIACYVNMTDEEIADYELKAAMDAFSKACKNDRGDVNGRYAEHEPAGIYL